MGAYPGKSHNFPRRFCRPAYQCRRGRSPQRRRDAKARACGRYDDPHAPPGEAETGRECERGPLAQLVEQGTFNPKVAGSSPARPTSSSSSAAFVGPSELVVTKSRIALKRDLPKWAQGSFGYVLEAGKRAVTRTRRR